MVNRILPHEKKCRGFWQSIGTKISAGVNRLLGSVEQQPSAYTLRAHHPHRILRNCLMREKVELEAFTDHRFINRADLALPSRTGV